MELWVAIMERRSVRQFSQAAISKEDLRTLIGAAVWAPSAMNRQPWRFAVVTDPLVLQAIEAKSKAWILKSDPQGIRNPEIHKLLRDPKYHLLHGAPVLIAIGAPAQEKWCAEDSAMAAQNLMLKATEFGLGTCWIGLVQDWLNTPEGLAVLQFPPSVRVVAPIIVGEPAGQIAGGSRKAPNIVWIGSEGSHFQEGHDVPKMEQAHTHFGELIHP